MLPDDLHHRVIETALGDPGQGPVPAQLAEGLYPPVAIDQHQPIRAFNDQDRLALSVGLHRQSQLVNARRIDDARRFEPPIQAVQIDFDGGIAVAVHARHRTPDQRSGP
jgi:hypothetical protein